MTGSHERRKGRPPSRGGRGEQRRNAVPTGSIPKTALRSEKEAKDDAARNPGTTMLTKKTVFKVTTQQRLVINNTASSARAFPEHTATWRVFDQRFNVIVVMVLLLRREQRYASAVFYQKLATPIDADGPKPFALARTSILSGSFVAMCFNTSRFIVLSLI